MGYSSPAFRRTSVEFFSKLLMVGVQVMLELARSGSEREFEWPPLDQKVT
jgi:hypothetical protein